MKRATCYLEGCSRFEFIDGLCKHHYIKACKSGLSPEDKEEFLKIVQDENWEERSSFYQVCSVEGCNELAHTKKMCRRHYTQLRYQIRAEQYAVEPRVPKVKYENTICYIHGCGANVFCRGLCKTHYKYAYHYRLDFNDKDEVAKFIGTFYRRKNIKDVQDLKKLHMTGGVK